MKIKLLTGLMTATLLLSGCSGDEESSSSEKTKKTEKASKKANVNCSETNSATFTSELIDGSDFDLQFIYASRHEMSSGDETYPAVNILITDFDTGGSAWKSPKGDQRKIILMITGKAGEKMQPGEYPAFGSSGFGADKASSFTIVTEIENVAMWGSGGAENTSGTTHITYVDDHYICGTMDLTDSKGSSIQVSFSTEIHKPLGS